MNEECALLHLMAMGVPVELAEHLARWIKNRTPFRHPEECHGRVG